MLRYTYYTGYVSMRTISFILLPFLLSSSLSFGQTINALSTHTHHIHLLLYARRRIPLGILFMWRIYLLSGTQKEYFHDLCVPYHCVLSIFFLLKLLKVPNNSFKIMELHVVVVGDLIYSLGKYCWNKLVMKSDSENSETYRKGKKQECYFWPLVMWTIS